MLNSNSDWVNPNEKVKILQQSSSIDSPEPSKSPSPKTKQEIKTEGHEEALKDQLKEEYQNSEKLDKLLANATEVIFKVRTVFPFVFFPHEITITLSDVSVVFGKFFSSREVRTVAIGKIAEVIVTTGFLFAELKIVDREFSQMTMEIAYLPVKDAMRAKRLIQGLLFASKEGVDLTNIKDDQLVHKLEELGRVQGEKADNP